MDWSAVDYCDVFNSCLDSYSDGTHSLHPYITQQTSPEIRLDPQHQTLRNFLYSLV